MEYTTDKEGLLFVGKDSDGSSVYIVKEQFVQDGYNFNLKVRFVLLEISQAYQNHQYYLKDRGFNSATFAHIEELWEFDSRLNNFKKLNVSYWKNDGKLIYESLLDDPQWISLKKFSSAGIFNKVYQIAMNQLIDIGKLYTGPVIRKEKTNEGDVTEIESFNFRARVTKKVLSSGFQVHVSVDQIDPNNRKPIKLVYIFLRNGSLRKDLGCKDGIGYDRVAQYNFQNEREIDDYIDNLKQYLILLDNKIADKSLNEIELIQKPNTVISSPLENKSINFEFNEPNDDLKCPRCGSPQLHGEKRGFGWVKSSIGLVTGFGLFAGFIGSRKIQVTCLRCGHHWIAGKNR